jgi:hypothetical protein
MLHQSERTDLAVAAELAVRRDFDDRHPGFVGFLRGHADLVFPAVVDGFELGGKLAAGAYDTCDADRFIVMNLDFLDLRGGGSPLFPIQGARGDFDELGDGDFGCEVSSGGESKSEPVIYFDSAIITNFSTEIWYCLTRCSGGGYDPIRNFHFINTVL